MRIAFIRQRYNPYGGAERFVQRAMRALIEQGESPTVIARDWPQAAAGDARFIRCDPQHRGRLSRDLTFAAEACGIVARESFDLVQSHERLPCCDVYRAGDGVHAQWLEYRGRARSALDRLSTRWSVYHRYVLAAERRVFASRRLGAVICNSNMVREDILRHYAMDREKLHVIYNGVDLEQFHPRLRESLRGDLRASLGIEDAARVFLFVGSGFERKGVDRVLRALGKIEDRTAHAVIVGEDQALPASRRLAQKLGLARRVLFVGAQDDVRAYYAAADVFVLPTLYDPFPNAALEALACGVPVITTRQCGAAELIREGENGGVCDVFDERALVQLMNDAASWNVDAARRHAREAVEHLGLDAMAGKLVALYRSVAKPPTN